MHLLAPVHALSGRMRGAMRVALSPSIVNASFGALGLLLIASVVHALAGAAASGVASIGVIVCIAPDQAAPRRGKFWHLLPAAVFGWPLFVLVQALHAHPLYLGLLLVPATFLAFLAGAWGRRGLPIVVSIMFAMVFSMAVPPGSPDEIWRSGLWFGVGALAYLVWATLINALLNGWYRVLLLADTLLALAGLMRVQASQFTPLTSDDSQDKPLIGQLLARQATLADQLQAARDLLLESPRTPRRQQLAAMLMRVLEIRDHLLACELDLQTQRRRPSQAPSLAAFGRSLSQLADALDTLSDAMRLGSMPAAPAVLRAHLAAVPRVDETMPAPPEFERVVIEPPARAITASLADRIGHIDDEVQRLVGVARGDVAPNLAIVRTAWQMFVSPTSWSWAPFLSIWHWNAPPLRHAIRAALAIGTAYAISLALPWGSHDYWILLTIVVVLRGSLAQTIERRNSRVAGTLLGCVLAAALLWLKTPHWALMLVISVAQAVAHGFALRRYLVTAVAATILGLIQAHMVATGRLSFDVLERLADTLLGAGIAWVFSYVLPSWERGQLPALVRRTLDAQRLHAQVALGLGQLQSVDDEPELRWRLARREAYDSLSALVQATQRALVEPRAVRPPLEPLAGMTALGYQLLAQLTAVKTMLMLRRQRLDAPRLAEPLERASQTLSLILDPAVPFAAHASARARSDPPAADARLADDSLITQQTLEMSTEDQGDLTPWALRRLHLSAQIAGRLRSDADVVTRALAPADRRLP